MQLVQWPQQIVYASSSSKAVGVSCALQVRELCHCTISWSILSQDSLKRPTKPEIVCCFHQFDDRKSNRSSGSPKQAIGTRYGRKEKSVMNASEFVLLLRNERSDLSRCLRQYNKAEAGCALTVILLNLKHFLWRLTCFSTWGTTQQLWDA